ncbi:MAG: TonB-dependent receptor [Bryobacterales bacterium]|nr:TonB-dependent receptor [Bryobacterales bacterium]
MSRFVTILLLSTAMSASLFGQAFTGSISGLVTDSSGAIIAGAAITITDIDKNSNYRTTSNATGFYSVSQLPPANYRVTSELQGFRRFVADRLPLTTQQRATLDITMEVGAVTEQVEVTAEAQLLESATATLSGLVENKRILDLPLNGRNVYSLAGLVPGVFLVRQTGGVADTFTANRFIVNGGQESTSDIVLDGVTATVSHNITNIPAVSAIPSVEGIQEFRIQTNAFAAEYGRSGGGLVTLVTKSGTNALHGSLFEFLRNSKLDANNFFANRAGRPLASFKRNQYGGSFGGPISIPKIYNGKDKTFFFVLYEGQRIRAASIAQHTVPSDLERSGDFSQTYAVNGQMRLIYNPLTTRPDPSRPGRYLRDAFPGNRIPLSMISPVALKSQAFYPQANSPGLPFTHQNNLVLQDAYPQPQDRVEFKIDHNFNDRRRMFGRYTFMDSVYSKPNFWGNLADPGCCDPMNQRLQNLALDYTENIGTTMVLNLRYGLGRVSGNRVPWSASFKREDGFKVAELGLPAYIDNISDHRVFPTITIQDMTQLGPNGGDIYFMGDTSHSMIVNISRVQGRHSMKYGIDARFNYVNYGQLGTPSGNFAFNRDKTQGPDPRTPTAAGGAGYASFLLGFGTGNITHQIRPANYNRYFAFYVQDDFKVNSKLTLNAGFRWDFEGGVTERFDRITGIDPYARNPLADQLHMDLKGIALFAGGSLGRRQVRPVVPTQVNPRLGIAYQWNDKTVIRTGYGIFFGLPSYAASSGYTGGAFSGGTTWISTVDSDGITPSPTAPWTNPFPNGFTLPLGSAAGPNAALGQGLGGGWEPSLRPMYNQQWNFTIQRSLPGNAVWEIAYAGNKGTRLSQTYQFNQLDPALLSMGDQLLQQVPNPFYGIINPAFALGAPTVQRGNLLRPYPQYAGVSATNAGWANSNYHALQSRFEKRFSMGLSFLASYTFSKTITDAADGLWNRADLIRSYYCRSCERAVSSYDQPHRFVANSTYELPFGKGKAFGGSWNRTLNAIAGNWQVNGILTLSQGLPLFNFRTPDLQGI